MKIGAVTLPSAYLPTEMTPPRARRVVSTVPTYGGVAFFSWGSYLAGTSVKLKWETISKTLFESLDAVYLADASVVWESDINSKKYNVQILDFEAGLLFGQDFDFRVNAEMVLLILDEVVEEEV